jgi:hypothetical protein
MVTAEMAFSSLFAAGFVVLIAWVVAVLALFIRCQSTADEVARQEARGDSHAAAKAIESRPEGAEVSITKAAELVRVRVELQAKPWAEWLPAVPLSVEAAVMLEGV